MAKTCPVTGEKVLYLTCTGCIGRLCNKIDTPSSIKSLNESGLAAIKEASKSAGLNIHNWRDDSIHKVWKIFSNEVGPKVFSQWDETCSLPAGDTAIKKFFDWLRYVTG